MRITFVSAHYPPNFVSGGTLQPQRLARGLRARGHDVSVFAGFLDSERRPLSSWEEDDGTGMPVRWVVSTPFMDWADERNYDNAAIAEVFAEHLAEHPADVVHLHALQTLGGGLVEVAKRSGAATVVTMHDFWWVCARQFLVERSHRPCCLVVDAGDCPCEVGRPHLVRRAERLRQVLSYADLVLAPSRSAAEVLRANGVDPTRLEVDENGMDLPPPAPPRTRLPGPVVVRYTGGSNPMKGADVLIEAAHLLGREPRLRLVAHDLADAVERDGRDRRGTSLECAPAYAPAELDDLLSATDALVLPSVMRESHSLVTREALLRGVPVVATDTIGPEEVVRDGSNGLIVPAADAPLLARAIGSLLDEPVLTRLREGAAEPLAVRSVEDQIAGLEARYDALVATAADPRPTPSVGRVLFVVGIDGAPLRYRAHLPAEAMALAGVHSDVRWYRDPDVADLAAEADVIVVYRVPATVQVLELIRRSRDAGTPVLFDVDDLIFDPGIAAEIPALRLLPPDEAALWLEGVRRYRTTMESCDAFIGSTPALVAHARDVVGMDAYLFENGVGTALGVASDIALRRPRRPGPLRVGYLSGTTTHDDDWRHVEAAVASVLVQHPDVELWLGGHLTPTESVLAPLGDRVRRLPFMTWVHVPAVLRDLDVNLAPLEPASRFNEAKSAIKWLEAALAGTPTIASPSGPFADAIDDGVTGWLAPDLDSWSAILDRVLGDPDERSLVGARARRAALLRWSPHEQGRRYQAILEQVASRPRHRQPAATWTPVALDEPPLAMPAALEPYPVPLEGSIGWKVRKIPRPGPVRRLRTKLGAVRRSLSDDGVRATVDRATRALRRVTGRDRDR
ncbi:MAG: glycosyltransferase [Acidimicrobiales bacterium]